MKWSELEKTLRRNGLDNDHERPRAIYQDTAPYRTGAVLIRRKQKQPEKFNPVIRKEG